MGRTSVLRAVVLACGVALAVPAFGAEASNADDLKSEIQALKARIAELEKKENENWLTQERASQIKGLVQEVLADAKTRGQFADGDLQAGYKDGFFIQTSDEKFKLLIGGYAQIRYLYGNYNKKNVNTAPNASDPGDANGFEIRRARLNFSGNIFTPDLFFKIEGDFGGAASNAGNFQLTDVFIGYRVNDLLGFRAGSFKVPFAKAELNPDPTLGMLERPDVLFPFDPIRALGLSAFGEVVKSKVAYEVNINDGGRSNLAGRADDISVTGAQDNRLGFYGRMQWAGAGTLSDFQDEPDLRKDTSNFVWLLGGAAGYESQNGTTNAFPHGQTTTGLVGLSTADSPGFTTGTLNGDIFRGTVDWSAKYRGLSILTAAYFQQVNQNGGALAGGATSPSPYGATDASFFQTGYYAQAGYFVIARKLEVVGRVGQLLTEGYPNRAEFYTLGLNYYFYGHNAKLMGDVTYSPEAAFTDASSDQIINTHEMIYRLQMQLKF